MARVPRLVLPLLALLVAGWPLLADDSPQDPRVIDAGLPDLTGFKTVDTCIATRVSRAAPALPGQPAYLGVHLDSGPAGQLVIADVDPDSPAAKAGLRPGDVLEEIGGQKPTSAAFVGDLLRSMGPGDPLKLAVRRSSGPVELTVTLEAVSRPLSLTTPRPTLGIQIAEDPAGVKIEQVVPGSPASEAGIRPGDVLVKLDGTPVSSPDKLTAILADKKPGDRVALVLRRGGKDVELTVRLAATADGGSLAGWDTRMTLFRKPVYNLAVVCIEYPDVKHNPKVSTWDWEQALFSQGVYIDKSPTGQQVYGSLNDYYLEQSCGALRVTGKVFDWVQVDKRRNDYANATSRFALLTEALDKVLARDGADALRGFDGIFFLYAGDRVATNRGGLYWPHRSTVLYKARRWNYFICPEGGSRMANISVIAHEFGHMLGLPDLYARPEAPGSEGLGVWCTMAVGHGRDGKPLHMSAWCKEQLGWLKPTVIDPTVKQKLILGPITHSNKECYKILVRPDGSEYFLLENRVARNFDRDLPAEGLLIWRIVDGRPVLEESHGIAGPPGPDRFLASVPYPSKSNTAFTPYTTPSSKSLKGGGLPVHITNIRRLPDGRITFYIGYEYM